MFWFPFHQTSLQTVQFILAAILLDDSASSLASSPNTIFLVFLCICKHCAPASPSAGHSQELRGIKRNSAAGTVVQYGAIPPAWPAKLKTSRAEHLVNKSIRSSSYNKPVITGWRSAFTSNGLTMFACSMWGQYCCVSILTWINTVLLCICFVLSSEIWWGCNGGSALEVWTACRERELR